VPSSKSLFRFVVQAGDRELGEFWASTTAGRVEAERQARELADASAGGDDEVTVIEHYTGVHEGVGFEVVLALPPGKRVDDPRR
jgi:hypothetical protein